MENDLLLENLKSLKLFIKRLDFKNILFFNKKSQYIYFQNEFIADISLKEILDIIYCSIPLLLSDEALSLLMDSLYNGDLTEFETVSKIDFYNFAKKHIDNWEYVEKLCLGINSYLKTEISLL